MVSEKTGYPVEMLELEMGLDADLGIDSIKRVEILSALQERLPGAPVIGPEQLGTLRTLGNIAAFLEAGASARTPLAVPSSGGTSLAPEIESAGIAAVLLSVVSEKTGYPAEMLELEMGLDADLGIDSIKRVEILSALQEKLPGAPVIGPEQLGTLRTLGDISAFLGGSSIDSPPVAPPAAPDTGARTVSPLLPLSRGADWWPSPCPEPLKIRSPWPGTASSGWQMMRPPSRLSSIPPLRSGASSSDWCVSTMPTKSRLRTRLPDWSLPLHRQEPVTSFWRMPSPC